MAGQRIGGQRAMGAAVDRARALSTETPAMPRLLPAALAGAALR